MDAAAILKVVDGLALEWEFQVVSGTCFPWSSLFSSCSSMLQLPSFAPVPMSLLGVATVLSTGAPPLGSVASSATVVPSSCERVVVMLAVPLSSLPLSTWRRPPRVAWTEVVRCVPYSATDGDSKELQLIRRGIPSVQSPPPGSSSPGKARDGDLQRPRQEPRPDLRVHPGPGSARNVPGALRSLASNGLPAGHWVRARRGTRVLL